MSVVLRSQIQESEAIRQTQAIEHICITPASNRDSPLLRRDTLNTANYSDRLDSALAINNELRKIISSSVIGHW
ncbi:hypothetical protein [Microcoleus sp. herbarium14]|uniref:hypothetical protein n=1 Tax=Microcoleus sp. herbarium14 TaxID=3055439 RepID=UPI002FD62A6E